MSLMLSTPLPDPRMRSLDEAQVVDSIGADAGHQS